MVVHGKVTKGEAHNLAGVDAHPPDAVPVVGVDARVSGGLDDPILLPIQPTTTGCNRTQSATIMLGNT